MLEACIYRTGFFNTNEFMKSVVTILIFCLTFQLTIAQSVFVNKPYAQIGDNASPSTLKILWHAADSEAKWELEHRHNSNTAWVKADAITYTLLAQVNVSPNRVYHACISGLKPGETFQYRILKEGMEVFSAEAKAIKSFNQSYRFVVMGDIGAETIDQKKLAYQAYIENPDFIAVPGDIVYENGLVSEYNKKFWPVYNADKADSNGAPIMRSIPFIAAVGNHDADTRDLDKKPDALAYYMFFDQPLNGPLAVEGSAIVPILKGSEKNKKAFYDAAGETYPRMSNFSYDYGNAHWTVIDADTYVDWTDSTLKNWVINDLAASRNATWHFVMFHHPGFNSALEHYEQQHMRLLAPIFEKAKVDIVFNGHVHNYQRTYPMFFKPIKNGTLMVGGKDNKTVRGRVVVGKWTLDKTFDGITNTHPKGVIYVITGAGGQELYNPEQENDSDSWQKFTNKFISTVHSITSAEVKGNKLVIRQIDTNGKELDKFVVEK
jgi:predicted phosphodiesterase